MRASTLAKAGKLVAKGHGQEARLDSHPWTVRNMDQQLRVKIRSGISNEGQPQPAEVPVSPWR